MDLLTYYSVHSIRSKPQLLNIVNAICKSSISIEKCIRYSALRGFHGDYRLSTNASGDVQKKLDVISNDLMIGNLIDTGACNVLLSEENESPIYVPIEKRGVYLVAFDPLDGSSNIECNAPIGTIFSICENKEEHVLINGNMIEIAGYILYGPSTELVISVDCKVDRFVLSPRGEYIHVGSVSLEGKTKKIYSVNEANSMTWENDVKSYIDQYKTGCSGYSARYIGSMVGDVHRTLLYGGIFSYPADKKNKDGKLRLLYECYPIAKLFEDAGGKALVGNMSDQRILDAEPKAIHQRSPVLFGTLQEVEKYEIILRNIVSKL